MKRYEELTFSDDFMFSAVLYDNPDIARQLAEKITGRKVKEIVHMSKEEMLGNDPLLKKVRMDVRFADDEAVYCIEMQMYKEKYLPKRLRYYASVNDIDQLKEGDTYDQLKPTYVVFICNYDPFRLNRRKYTFRNRCDEDPSYALNDESVKIVLNTMGDRESTDEELNCLLNYIATGKPDKEHQLTERIEEAVEKVRCDRDWRERFMTYHFSVRHELELVQEAARRELLRTSWNDVRKMIRVLQKTGMDNEKIKEVVLSEYCLSDEEYEIIRSLKEDLTEKNDQIVRDWLEREV